MQNQKSDYSISDSLEPAGIIMIKEKKLMGAC
jgi:hypothetical protein